MNNLLQRLIPLLLAGCTLSLCSCAREVKDDPAEVAEKKMVAEVRVVFEAGTRAGMTRVFRTRDLRVMRADEAGEDYDVGFDAWFMGDGRVFLKPTWRNLIHVGIGDQAAFEKLVGQFGSWMVNNLDAVATAAGIPAGERGRGYWRPAEFPLLPGHIFAMRNRHPAPVPPGGMSDREVGALLYVKSVSKSGNLVLLVARAPNARAE